jgi:thiol-activated cytolysin
MEQTITPPPATDRRAIDEHIRSLEYDPAVLLAVQREGSAEKAPVARRERTNNAVIVTTRTERSLRRNLSDVVILRPSAGVIYPGALVRVDQRLRDGQPTPVSLPRGPITLSVDLPGLQNGRRRVDDPSHSSVQDTINAMLEEWNANPASQGYANAARSIVSVEAAFSSQQVALELGFTAEWAGGEASAQLDAGHSRSRTSILAFFKQVFYTVTMDAPNRPSDVFAPDVPLEEVRRAVSAAHPPAYVRSVDYGRILMLRVESSARRSHADLKASFQQMMKGVEVGANAGAGFSDEFSDLSITAVAIGGGAQSSASFSGNAEDLQRLSDYISADATYRRDNPGAPISYVVAYLRDNEVATMGFTTDYTEIEQREHPNGFIRLRHAGGYVGKFEVTWEEPDENLSYQARKWESGNKTAGFTQQLDLPGDARNIRIRGLAMTGLVWDPWGEAINVTESGPTNKCYRITGTTLNRGWDNHC